MAWPITSVLFCIIRNTPLKFRSKLRIAVTGSPGKPAADHYVDDKMMGLDTLAALDKIP